MKKSFLNKPKPLITSMVTATTPQRVKELVEKSIALGADAVGMQFCRMEPKYRTVETYKDLFSFAKDLPIYVTNYRGGYNVGKSDEILVEELIELSECGADLCDVIGDLYDKQPNEVTTDKTAIKKQKMLVDELHSRGSEVLISSHMPVFMPPEKVLDIALGHQERGADISKIVTFANNMEQQLENIKTIELLKNKLEIPFLFLCNGECNIIRRIGGDIGCCTYLCVAEHDDISTPVQPLIESVKAIRNNLK